MNILELTQGSPEWLAARAKYFTASEASVMMGASKKMTRNDLLRVKATGAEHEVSDFTRDVIFERGHEVEALARPIAEQIIGEDLYPVTATDDDDYLLASFDGITMLGDKVWECKQWNKAKAEMVRGGEVPEEDRWQVVQQLHVSGAEKCLYMVTDGTPENTVHTWYSLRDDDAYKLTAGWAQFGHDLKNYQPAEPVVEVVGKRPENLPALHIEVTGMVKASNLSAFKEYALDVADSIKTDLTTDEDFATAKATVKWIETVESKLKAAKDHAQSQMESVDELFRTIDDIGEQFRQKRLTLEKRVATQQQAIRDGILVGGKNAFAEHVTKLEASIEETSGKVVKLGVAVPDFAGAMKNKRTLTSLRDAVDGELAKGKIAANEVADKLRTNLARLESIAKDHRSLFSDWRQLIDKDGEAMEAIAKQRIAEHEAAEEKRREQEREQIREQEAKKLREAQEESQRIATTQTATDAPTRPATPALDALAAMPRPAQAVASQVAPRRLLDELAEWRHQNGVSDAVYEELLDILDRHHALKVAA